MSSLIVKFSRGLFGDGDTTQFHDICFWLLLLCINISGNLGLFYIVREQIILIVTTMLLSYLCFKRQCYGKSLMVLLLPICAILGLQVLYLSTFSLNTSLHYILKIVMATSIVCLCGSKFPRYFSSIIFVYALISLICFALNKVGVIIPFFPIPDEIEIDGGNVFRVYNLFYTQLYNPIEGGLILRNCGPFWEPGAYQGFLNLALWFELSMDQVRDKYWKFRLTVIVASIVTTYSTGGYIVLFAVFVLFAISDNTISQSTKIIAGFVVMIFAFYAFFELPFLREKLMNDTSRTQFDFFEAANFSQILLGYGLDVDSFSQSSLQSASSIFQLFRYFGVVGFAFFMGVLLNNKTPNKVMYFIIVSMILMNEPFLTNSPLFWGLAFVTYNEFEEQEELCESF